jgi:hypothetical protein
MSIEKIYGKINSINTKVELAQIEVELASAKDLLNLYGKAVSMSNELLGGAPSKIDELKKYLITTEKLSVKLIGDLDGSLIDYLKITKELGIDANQNKNYTGAKKVLDDLYKGTSNITKVIQSLK